MYAFVALVYGLVVPLVLLYIKEVHFRGKPQEQREDIYIVKPF
jgi:hypothetical protein